MEVSAHCAAGDGVYGMEECAARDDNDAINTEPCWETKCTMQTLC